MPFWLQLLALVLSGFVAWLGATYAVAMRLVTAGRVLPQLTDTGLGWWVARWRPLRADLATPVAELAAQLEAFDKRNHVTELAAHPVPEEQIEAVAVVAPAAAPSFDFSNLALAPLENETATIAPALAAVASSGLGAVVILAGLGGPDAVRQL